MSLYDPLIQNYSPDNESLSTAQYYPEPNFVITIKPTLLDGDATFNGQAIRIKTIPQPVTLLTIVITNDQQQSILTLQDGSSLTINGIFVLGFNCSNFLFEQQGSATLNLTMRNLSIAGVNTIDNGYDLASPFIDLIQTGFIVSIEQTNSINLSDSQFLFTGFIANYSHTYDTNGLACNIGVESYLTPLTRSAAVQTAAEQFENDVFIQGLTAQVLNFDELLNQMLNETIISQSLASIQYYKAPQEQEAIDTEGSAISPNSQIFIDTPPTDSKLDIILRTLYPYQRVFYVNNAGNFIITPLQAYFNPNENWNIALSGDADSIPARSITITRNDATIKNRTTTSLNQLFTLFNRTTTTAPKDDAVGAIAVATPVDNNLFQRLTEFIVSGKYLQTLSSVTELNRNLIKNSGLLNIANNFFNVQGLVSKGVKVNDNLDYIETADTDTDKVKYYLRLYAAKALAEQLFQETQVEISIPVNRTFNPATQKFRTIPLNELVNMPSMNNKLLSEQPQYFCYGFGYSYNVSTGAMLDLYLTKPYTYTALWSDEPVELLSISGFE